MGTTRRAASAEAALVKASTKVRLPGASDLAAVDAPADGDRGAAADRGRHREHGQKQYCNSTHHSLLHRFRMDCAFKRGNERASDFIGLFDETAGMSDPDATTFFL